MDRTLRHSKKKRRGYQYCEDMAIINYISQNNLFMFVNGNECWDTMAIKRITPHSASSMRTHFLKLIVKKLDTYDLPSDLIAKFLAYSNFPYNNEISSEESYISNDNISLYKVTSLKHDDQKCLCMANISNSTPINIQNCPPSLNRSVNGPYNLLKTFDIKSKLLKEKRGDINIKNKKLVHIDDNVSAISITHNDNPCSNTCLSKIEASEKYKIASQQNKNNFILDELRKLHKSFKQVPINLDILNNSSLENQHCNGHNQSNYQLDVEIPPQLIHNIHILLAPLREVSHFLTTHSTSALCPVSPMSSSQFYTPILEFQDGRLFRREDIMPNELQIMNNIEPSYLSSQCDTSSTLYIDMFPALHTQVIDSDNGSLTLNNQTMAQARTINAEKGGSNTFIPPNKVLRRSQRTNLQNDKLQKLQELCESLNLTPIDIYTYLRDKGWLKEILDITIASNDSLRHLTQS